MTSIPLKPQYGPTLGRLLEPRWRSAAPTVRALVIVAGVGLLALMIAIVLSLLNASYSQSGAVPFSFEYRGLYRTSPNAGGYVRVMRSSGKKLKDSYAVAPLAVGPYSGSITGELPLAAAAYTRTLAARFSGFRLEGEGKTRISSALAGYDVLYSALVHGQKLYGRDVILIPPHHGARQGVVVEMLSSEPASISKPVASSGILETPLKTFEFG
ncbi:MAG TPA: hypothetical protein VGP18_10210 [Solirubrobacteraceae bacterium]|jgi:hypothetical protein|nr:hypothetical protein [Solirubrobacteraceae bacterium]